MTPSVYILKVRDGRYYVGSTSNLEQRVAEHNQGMGSTWTATRRPVEVVYSQNFATMREAVEAERQLKGWGRAKKEALIRGDWDKLPELAKSYTRLSILRRTQDDI